MEIIQQVWGFTPGEDTGEAIIIYTLTNTSGASVQVTNIGASLVSASVPDRNGVFADVVAAPAPLLVNRVWEGRVEGNRVVFSIVVAEDDCELAAEVAYHFSEDNELEIVCAAEFMAADAGSDNTATKPHYIAATPRTQAPRTADFAPRTRFNLAADDHCFEVKGWRKNILAEAGSVSDEATGRRLVVLTSLPRIRVYGNGGSDTPKEQFATETPLPSGEKQIQKTVYRFEVVD